MADGVDMVDGYLPMSQVPLVAVEPIERTLGVALIFYVIIVLALLYIYTQTRHSDESNIATKCTLYKSANMPRKKTLTYGCTVTMQQIRVYSAYKKLDIQHIVLLDVTDNILDIDISSNSFVRMYAVGEGYAYDIDFGSSREIKEVTIIVDPADIGSGADPINSMVNIELYNRDKIVWEYTGVLNNSTETTIGICKSVTYPEWEAEKLYSDTDRELRQENERMLLMRLHGDQ